jgi:hypothetical protein
MKRYFKLAVAALACISTLPACNDDIRVGKPFDETPYTTLNENNAFLRDTGSGKNINIVELYGTHTTSLTAGLTKAATAAVNATIKVDPAWLTSYNTDNNTDYKLYPTSSVTISGGGAMQIAPGSVESAPVTLTITRVANLDPAQYVVPVVMTVTGAGVTLKESVRYCLYHIKDTGAYSVEDTDKGENRPKGFVFFNNHNPLNALSFELENGKLLWDVVCLFSGNINYNTAEGRPHLTLNTEMKFALDNYDAVVKPLQDRGTKVVLGLLGNHDMAGLAQLSNAAAKDFAAQVAATVYAYGLDGVCLDDEYSTEPDLSNPAFVARSYSAAARMCYELKQAMPDKMVTVYEWGAMFVNRFPAQVEGKKLNEFIDISIADYGALSTTTTDFSKTKGSGASLEFSTYQKDANLHLIKNVANLVSPSKPDGFTWFAGFAPVPEHYTENFTVTVNDVEYTVNGVFPRLYEGVEAIYGSKLKPPTVFYKSLDTKPYVYPDDL